MRIHIIGPSGSGKSTYAHHISRLLQIPHYDLDDLYWDNAQQNYGTKMPEDKRNRQLHQILLQDTWIIEGIYISWIQESLQRADRIILLDMSLSSCRWRVIKRYLKRKLGFEKNKRETLKTLVELLRWMKIDHPAKQTSFEAIEKLFPTKTIRLKAMRELEKIPAVLGNDS